jgi:hypothetical protein
MDLTGNELDMLSTANQSESGELEGTDSQETSLAELFAKKFGESLKRGVKFTTHARMM